MTDGTGLHARIVVRRDNGFLLDVDLVIEAGTTTAMLGPNGSGKSTTVAALAGLLPVDAGLVTLAGRVLDDPAAATFVPPERRRIGVVFQQYLLFEHLDVLDNVAFGPMASGVKRRTARASARRWLEEVGLGDLGARRPRELSGGQAQRAALARALATEPDLLLLDEPLAALDIDTRSAMRRTLRRHLGAYPGPRLVITHDPTDAFLLADRIVVLENGRLTQAGTADEIRSHPATPYVAALAGTNLLSATNDHGALTLDGSPLILRAADTHTNGPVLVTIHPSAIAVHQEEPHGSPRNAWATTIAAVEPLGDTTRLTLGPPLALSVDITPGSTRALGLVPGSPVWASVKATEIGVTAA